MPTIPAVIIEGLPAGGNGFADGLADGLSDKASVGVGNCVGDVVVMGTEVGVGVKVADGVAASATCVPKANTIKVWVIVLNTPDASLVIIVMVWLPGERGLDGLKFQLPFLSAKTW